MDGGSGYIEIDHNVVSNSPGAVWVLLNPDPIGTRATGSCVPHMSCYAMQVHVPHKNRLLADPGTPGIVPGMRKCRINPHRCLIVVVMQALLRLSLVGSSTGTSSKQT